MDVQRFDALTRALGAAGSRRRLLRSALGGVAIANLVALPAASARPTCRANGASCTRNAQCCSNGCETSRSAPRARRNRCVCVPDCENKVCGDDGCGGSCGVCSRAHEFCDAGTCTDACAAFTGDDPNTIFSEGCVLTTEGVGAIGDYWWGGAWVYCTATSECVSVAGPTAICGVAYKNKPEDALTDYPFGQICFQL